MNFEITKDVIQDMMGLYGKEQAIKELQDTVSVIIVDAVEAAMKD
jgi:hypothetical protein